MGSKRQIFELLIALAAIAIPIVVQVMKAARKAREDAEQRAALVHRSVEAGRSARNAPAPAADDDMDEAVEEDLDPQFESVGRLQGLARAAEANLAEARARLVAMRDAQSLAEQRRKPATRAARAVASGHPLLAGSARAGFLWAVVLGPPGGRGSV